MYSCLISLERGTRIDILKCKKESASAKKKKIELQKTLKHPYLYKRDRQREYRDTHEAGLNDLPAECNDANEASILEREKVGQSAAVLKKKIQTLVVYIVLAKPR